MSQTDDRSTIRERLGKLFSVPFEQHGSCWDVLWQQQDLPFDRGAPNPALADTVLKRRDLVGKPVTVDDDGGKRPRCALVPGCGRGYDVLLLASLGYEAYGLEVSPEAIKACEVFAADNFTEYCKTSASELDNGYGSYKFILGNFFNNDWEQHLSGGHPGFDLIYDYTVSHSCLFRFLKSSTYPFLVSIGSTTRIQTKVVCAHVQLACSQER